MSKAAIFWDRDGTLIEDPGYLRDPDQVKLLPGSAIALKRLASAGFENIIATNQSGVARGMMDETTVDAIHLRLREMLAKEGAGIDAVYYCPFLEGDEAVVEKYRKDSDLRKPKPGMLIQASLERRIDLPGSWSIGDKLRDAEAGRAAGCRTILINADGGVETNTQRRSIVDFVARSPDEAAEIVLRHTPGAQVPSPSPTPATGSSSAPSPPPSVALGTGSNAGAVERMLSEVLSILQRMDRRNRADDFSLPRLGGAIMQMAAIGALIWSVFSVNEERGVQLIRLTYAMIFQLMALTAFLAGGRKS